jgi:hypothetical protein
LQTVWLRLVFELCHHGFKVPAASGGVGFGAYGNAQATGTVSLVTLERFCDEVLGWHPRMLYGEAYYQATLPTS